MKKIYLLLLICAITLAGCSEGGKETAEEMEPAVTEEETAEPEKTVDDRDWSALYDGYIDVESLPALDVDLEKEYVCDDRTLIMEDGVDNDLEYTVYKRYRAIVSADFDGLMELVGGSGAYKIANENERKNFNEGLYMKEYDIHGLTAVSLDEIKEAGAATKETLLSDIEECGLVSYAVVRADLSWKYNEAQLAAAPQLPEGRYVRYYLLGSAEKYAEAKICQTYWDDFL